jgi:hypothetical protein
MMSAMRYIILHVSAGSLLMPACLPIELSNFLTIRPFKYRMYKYSIQLRL